MRRPKPKTGLASSVVPTARRAACSEEAVTALVLQGEE